jgi:hypothetical protein
MGPPYDEATKKELIELYQQMSDHTKPECDKVCLMPHSCCDAFSCEMTGKYAKDCWGIDLPTTNHPKLPYMGPNGCTVAPHLRPSCTFHTCSVNSHGIKIDDDKDHTWTKVYFHIREEIQKVEWR